MYCPKCGSQNTDGTRFCRGCGADIGNVLAVVEGTTPEPTKLAEKQIETFSSGLRGVIIGIGFMMVTGLSLGISVRLAVIGLFALAFGVFFLGTGIARLVQAKALKNLINPKADEPKRTLTSGTTEYIRPVNSIYATDDLVATPHSVTDRTTRHLELDPDNDVFPTRKS